MVTTATAKPGNPYLEDFLAPVSTEVTAHDLRVTGRIPEHLDGRYLRNGPNPVAEVDPAVYHWFSGDGMVHGVALRDGQARWYRNRWVRSPSVCRTLGEPAPGRLDPRAGMLSLGANTSVLSHAGRTLALVEGGVANYELTEELDTVGTCDFDGTLAGGYTAHPHRDPRTGELHAVSYAFTRGRTVQYSVIDTAGRARRTVDIEVGGSPMMHDFSLTDKYVVIYDLPVTFDPVQVLPQKMPSWLALPARLVLQSLIGRVRVPSPINARMNRDAAHSDRMPYAWNPHYPARVGVMPREGGNKDVRWFDIEPCYVYHPLNAYSEMRGDAEVWCSTWCATRKCSTATGAAPAKALPCWTAGPSTSQPVRSPPSAGTISRRNSPGSTRSCWAQSTGSATRSVRNSRAADPGSSNTTMRRGPARLRRWTAAFYSARCPLCQTPPRAPKTTAS